MHTIKMRKVVLPEMEAELYKEYKSFWNQGLKVKRGQTWWSVKPRSLKKSPQITLNRSLPSSTEHPTGLVCSIFTQDTRFGVRDLRFVYTLPSCDFHA